MHVFPKKKEKVVKKVEEKMNPQMREFIQQGIVEIDESRKQRLKDEIAKRRMF